MKKTTNQKYFWDDFKLGYLIDNYKKLTMNDISNVVGIPRASVVYKLHSLGLMAGYGKSRKYIVNTDFLKEWSADLAYILGFIMADGCIFKSTLIVEIHEQDISVLEFIKEKLCKDNPIEFVKAVSSFNDSSFGKETIHVRLRPTSFEMVEEFKKYNIVSRKTGNEKLPNIPDEFKWDYLRGLFDGDGHISGGTAKHCHSYAHFGIASSNKIFLEDIQRHILKGVGCVAKTKTCYTLRITNKKVLEEIRNIFYNNDKFSLPRKKKKFMELDLEYYKNYTQKGKYGKPLFN